jgi:hypothetical protein
MRALKLTLGKIISTKFSLSFCLLSVKRPDGLSLRPDGCGSDGRMVMLHIRTRATSMAKQRKVTRLDARGLLHVYEATCVRTS